MPLTPQARANDARQTCVDLIEHDAHALAQACRTAATWWDEMRSAMTDAERETSTWGQVATEHADRYRTLAGRIERAWEHLPTDPDYRP